MGETLSTKRKFAELLVFIAVIAGVVYLFTPAKVESWKHMQVVLPSGTTPEETFEEIRDAALKRDWPRMYGCLTEDARRDQISQLAMDLHVTGYRARHDDEFVAVSPDRRPLTPTEMKFARECYAVSEKYGLVGRDFNSGPAPRESLDLARAHYGRCASFIENADLFVADAWNVLADPGTSLFEEDAYLTEMTVLENTAYAKVMNYHKRFIGDDRGYLHFKKIDGRWLIDMSPWWIPWGPIR